MNKKLVIALVGVLLLGAGVAGGAVWYLGKQSAATEGKGGKEVKHEEAKAADAEPPKYITVEKVIVMLRRSEGESVTHYLSADLVIATTAKQEKECKEHLPLLRSVAVKALSALPMAKASTMSIDQFAEELNKAFDETYAKDKRERPFNEVMIGKLILE
ncbi:flagellar basal body-associated FliL family protein [Pseudoduganella namucuonensis]|uniref:Flagellar protein FliL n=1 Tax=Pseudoduganella namucuonensis TaxID=1035707 RepID=A0A1I7HTY3_9BURK|nr:flagellar basal body-associated FliL family protein [Pseudoduganella namucuonensis]SFU64153.1 flagellar FliL protein [Pseudoduganella namucuonensis]